MGLKTISAIYESGVFKPLQPIKLNDHQRIRLIIETEEDISLQVKDDTHARIKTIISEKYGKEIITTSAQEAERVIDQLSLKVREGLSFATLEEMEQFLRSDDLDINR